MKIIISNGHFKFILGSLASELEKKGLLLLFITAGYPKKNLESIIIIFSKYYSSAKRLLERKEKINDKKIKTIWLSEIIQKIAFLIYSSEDEQRNIWYRFSLIIYGIIAKKIIKNINADIYHYRAGYGRESVIIAKNKMITICDHSIAHPRVLEYMIDNGGEFPEKNRKPEISKFWIDVEEDINKADYVIVNSDFVKDTFINRGWKTDRVFVAYAGLDETLIKNLPQRMKNKNIHSEIKFLFAGEGNQRKGLPELLIAFSKVENIPWRLEIVGNIDKSIEIKYNKFLNDKRINLIPFCSRLELAKKMGEAEVFIFPSLAEGSARVVFMAMAMGCFIITTPNSGSVVKNGINGILIRSGSVSEIKDAVINAYAQRENFDEIGEINSNEIINKYNQQNYAERIMEIYNKVK